MSESTDLTKRTEQMMEEHKELRTSKVLTARGKEGMSFHE